MTAQETDTRIDGIALLMEDHRRVEQLYERFTTTPRTDTQRRKELVNEIVRELSVHADIEERHLYPLTAKAFPGGEGLADHSVEEHQQIKEDLDAVDGLDADSDELDARLAAVMADVDEHVAEEEGELFPRLREAVGQEEVFALGQRLQEGRSKAPTHPHPAAPSGPLGHKLADPAAAVLDRARDATRDYPSDRS